MKVSIIMLAYNHEKFIRNALEGVLIQKTNFEFELIVANDHSTDNTEQLVNEYRIKNPAIVKGFYNKKNLGPRYNFIKAYNQAHGEYIAMCEGDDYWTDPYKLQKQVDFLDQGKEYVLCFHDIIAIDEQGKLVEGKVIPPENKRDYGRNEMLGIDIPTPTIVYRKVVKRLPSYLKKTDNGDTMVLCMLTPFGKAKYLPGISASCVRKHTGGVWTSKTNMDRWTHILKLRYLIFKAMDKRLRPEMFRNYILIFDSAAAEAIENNSRKYWYRYNRIYVQLCLAAHMYGKAWLVSKRILKRSLGFKQWLPRY